MEEAEERLVCRRLHEVGRVIDEGIALFLNSSMTFTWSFLLEPVHP